MSLRTEARYIQIPEIDRAGKYEISGDANRLDYNGVDIGPFDLPIKLIRGLYRAYPEVKRVDFQEADFNDGALTALKLDYIDERIDYDNWNGDEGYIDFDGHTYSFSCKKEHRGKHRNEDSFRFDLEDKGRMRVVENRLDVMASPLRDGKLHLWTHGYQFEDSPGRMIGSVELKGDHPGELISESLKIISRLAKRHSCPIWREYQDS